MRKKKDRKADRKADMSAHLLAYIAKVRARSEDHLKLMEAKFLAEGAPVEECDCDTPDRHTSDG
ncbi:MAG: hypothetical protein A2Y38_24670 [Spirochaetes bacterium GWB1_59_5]|nr:MAG: hypothetical protein A2Y38_24670 [Spirochaetes bacterium GWB1_59_5]